MRKLTIDKKSVTTGITSLCQLLFYQLSTKRIEL